MTEIDIRKDRLATREEPESWGHNSDWYSQHREISRVNIDTTHGSIDVCIDGKPVAPRQKPKPKRYVLPMPGTEYHNAQMRGNAQYYAVKTDTNWRPDAIALGTDDAVEHGYTVTQADIDAAPDWVKELTPAEVTDDEL